MKTYWLTWFSVLSIYFGLFPGDGLPQNKDSNGEIQQISVSSTPSGALVTIDGEYKITGRTPFYVTYPVSGKYRLVASKPGYENWSSDVFLTSNSENNIMVNLKRRTRLKAAVRSILVPGWGQFYSHRKFQAVFLTSAVIASSGFALYFQLDYKDEVDKFNRLRNQVTITPETLPQLKKQFEKLDDADQRRKRAFIVLGSLWAFNFLDALFFFPDFGQMDISGRKIQVTQKYSNDTAKIGLKFNF